jgi:hypothetical protein
MCPEGATGSCEMTSYPEDQGPYTQGQGMPVGNDGGAYPPGYQGGMQQGPGATQYQQMPHQGMAQRPWDQGGQGMFQGSSSQSRRRSVQVRSTFKTTEFWAYVVCAVAILIAAAVSDGDENSGFGAHDAWFFVTLLTIGYMLSRGLTKFGGHERDSSSSSD